MRGDKHQSFHKLTLLLFLMELARHVQSTQNMKLAIFWNIFSKVCQNGICGLLRCKTFTYFTGVQPCSLLLVYLFFYIFTWLSKVNLLPIVIPKITFFLRFSRHTSLNENLLFSPFFLIQRKWHFLDFKTMKFSPCKYSFNFANVFPYAKQIVIINIII